LETETVHPILAPRTLLTRTVLAGVLLVVVMLFCHVRIPRIILAALVGAALAGAGVIFQALLRNPLADPYILGISSGAGLGAMLAIISGVSWTLWGRSPVAVFAFVGALGTVWLVWGIGRITGRHHVTGLLLAGVVVNAFLSAMIVFLISVAKSEQIYATIFWLMGNMTEEDFLVLWVSGGSIAAGIVGLFLLSPQLNIISVGYHDAKSSGIAVERIEVAAFALSALITAVAVSLSGLIGFVGLIIPHAVRLLFGPDHRQLLPLSTLAGAMFLVVADTVARTIVAPAQLPVGVITAIVGGPFFLILLVRYSRKVYWLT
jgi:iron complex transport system permease protein